MSTKPNYDCAGRDSNGEKYESISNMWENELAAPTKTAQSTWYEKSEAYWGTQSASVAGMLGGLDDLHTRDVAASRKFLHALPAAAGRRRALDVGAGIGRVTKALLLPIFDAVDLLEQSAQYATESVRFLADAPGGAVGRRIVCGMQDFRAAGVTGRDGVDTGTLRGAYDVVWIQWCVIYLTDEHFVNFLRECAASLAPGGFIVLKDNVARAGFLVDKEDSSIMRSGPYLRSIFAKAGLEVFKEQRQLDFPRAVYPVRMYALRPVADADDVEGGTTVMGSTPAEKVEKAEEKSLSDTLPLDASAFPEPGQTSPDKP